MSFGKLKSKFFSAVQAQKNTNLFQTSFFFLDDGIDKHRGEIYPWKQHKQWHSMFDNLCKHVIVITGSRKLLYVDARRLYSSSCLIIDDGPVHQVLNPEKPVRVIVVLIQTVRVGPRVPTIYNNLKIEQNPNYF